MMVIVVMWGGICFDSNSAAVSLYKIGLINSILLLLHLSGRSAMIMEGHFIFHFMYNTQVENVAATVTHGIQQVSDHLSDFKPSFFLLFA